jgi:hypothetical protein
MSENSTHNCSLDLTDYGLKILRQAAALLECEEIDVMRLALNLVHRHAIAHAKGSTEVLACTSKQSAVLLNNQKFIEALCEEGVVEWLTPFVLPNQPPNP